MIKELKEYNNSRITKLKSVNYYVSLEGGGTFLFAWFYLCSKNRRNSADRMLVLTKSMFVL